MRLGELGSETGWEVRRLGELNQNNRSNEEPAPKNKLQLANKGQVLRNWWQQFIRHGSTDRGLRVVKKQKIKPNGVIETFRNDTNCLYAFLYC